MNITAFAKVLGVSRQTLHSILNESRSVTPELALRLGKALGNGAELWMSMQNNYSLWKARIKLRL